MLALVRRWRARRQAAAWERAALRAEASGMLLTARYFRRHAAELREESR